MMRYTLILLLISINLITNNVKCQNLVFNGDFETYTALPNSLSDWSFCTGWNNVNLSMSTWPYATPDYFHTNGTGDAKLPNCKYGTVSAHSGNGIFGLYSKHSSQLNSRDYIASQLIAPLTVGVTYTISFWITSGSAPYYYGSSCNHMGVQLSMAPLTQVNHENIGGTPQAEILTEHWSTNWVQYSFSYLATNAYQYVTVGNFNTDATTTTTVRAAANYTAGVYYFIDDLVIEPTVILPIELLSFDAQIIGKDVSITWQTNTEINNDYFTVEHSHNLENWQEVAVVKGAGNSSNIINYQLTDYNPYAGTSYYRLKQTDFDNKFEYTSNRAVTFNEMDENPLLIYPNPTENTITIKGIAAEIDHISLFNLLGQNLNHQILFNRGDGNVEVDLSNLSSGVYLLKTATASHKVYKK